ncbi:nucleotidyltransferase domain-containing protein [Streptomyces sp. NPDC017520]|uniref:nucleotidyltransferase domain-containing protein n=1 Tax=Streptomyces sp. NPDC017520 TaxID=3364998 RepID=UPI003794D5BE
MSERLPSGGAGLSPDEIEALDARWSSSWTPGEVAQRLAGVSVPWCVAAGWALDLFRGGRARVHGDIEIAIPEAGFPELRSRFPGYVFDAAGCKAKHAGPKDQRGFDATVPHLSRGQRATLAELLARVHPGHAWLTDL